MSYRSLLPLAILFWEYLTYSQTPFYYQNFPLIIDSNTNTSNISGYPLITDLEKDGQKEIVLSSHLNNNKAGLFVVNSNGIMHNGFPKIYNNSEIKSYVSGDIDNDGYLDIAVRYNDFNTQKNYIAVYDKNGLSLPGFPINLNTLEDAKWLSLYDIDNDGKPEIIAGKNNYLYVYKYNGQVMSGWPRQVTGWSLWNPAIGDIDGDNKAEIIISTFKLNPIDSGNINIYRYNGSNYSNNWPIYFDSSYICWSGSPSLVINKNNYSSTFICIAISRVYSSWSKINKLIKYNVYGDILNITYVIDYDNFGTLVIGDLDKNEYYEFVTGSQWDFSLSVFDNNFVIRPGWPEYGQGAHHSSILIGKTNNTGNLSVVADNWGWNFNYGDLYSYNVNGTAEQYSPVRFVGMVISTAFADLNNDGSVELIAVSQINNHLYLNAITFPGIPFTHEDHPWPQLGHDRYMTNQYGFIPPDEPIGIKPISEIVPNRFHLFQNYPNPFNPSTTIKFNVCAGSMVNISIYDITGRLVNTILNQQMDKGEYKIEFKPQELSSGVYFCRMNAENDINASLYSNTIKLLLIK